MQTTKIEKVEPILWDRWLLVKIYCEDGTVGIGEGGVHGWQRPTQTMLEVMTPYLLGQDPSRIEHHYQWLYRSSHFMGSVVQGALSAIDIALWDIKGKRLNVPIYDLMGGLTRERVRCYMHVRGDTLDGLVADAMAKVEAGFTAVRFSPFSPDFHLHQSYSEWADEAVRRVGAVREAVGEGVIVQAYEKSGHADYMSALRPGWRAPSDSPPSSRPSGTTIFQPSGSVSSVRPT